MIAQNKVLVRAGRFQGGKLPYVNYVGQIKPADMASIVWYGAFGDDTTGDGTISTPYETFAKALAEFSTITHKWVLNTDLTVYGESEPAAFIDDPADRVYLDPTKADDSGDGLTAANAKKTYAAAKAVLISSGRTAIHGVGSFTLTDIADVRLQGEIGETLTYDAAPDFANLEVLNVASAKFVCGIRTDAGTLLVFGALVAGGTIIYRSTDGINWNSITPPSYWSTSREPRAVCLGQGKIVVCGIGYPTSNDVIYSSDDGLTFSISGAIGGSSGWNGICYTGTNFVLTNNATSPPTRVFYSPDLATWTGVTPPYTLNFVNVAVASDGAGGVMIVGRKSATQSLLLYSADHGLTWTDITATTGFGTGANTGGSICVDVGFRDGYWYVVQDTITPAYYFSTSPTTLWTSISDNIPLFISTLTFFMTRFSWSSNKGGLVIAQTTDVGDEIGILNNTGYTVLTNAFGGYKDNTGSLIAGSGTFEVICIFGKNSSGNAVVKAFDGESTSIRGNLSNCVIISGGNVAKAGSSCTVYNVTSEQTSDNGFSALNEFEAHRCRFVSTAARGLVTIGDKVKAKRSIFKGADPVLVTGKAAAAGDIELTQNVFYGGLDLDNAGGTDKETIQDNIIIGNFSATELVTVKSNVSGAVVNSTSQSVVSTIPPIFVDTTDFFLSRIALGQTVDSPLISRSAYFTFTYSAATFKDDFGPYRAFTALVETVYKRAFLLPHFSGNALSEDVENVAALLKSIRGKPDVSNRPQGRLEIVSWQSKSVNSEVREFVSFMEKEKDLTVYLDYDFNGQAPDVVTIDGVHTSGTFELNIVPQDIPVGTVLSLFGKSQIVTQRYPRAGQATKLILDDVLSGGLVDTESVQVTYIQGAGTFVFVPSRPRKNLRIFARSRGSYSGMTYTFVRKAE